MSLYPASTNPDITNELSHKKYALPQNFIIVVIPDEFNKSKLGTV